MSKFTSILKIIGSCFGLAGGTVGQIIGIPLWCVGQNEINKAEAGKVEAETHRIEEYSLSNEYSLLKEEEEKKLENYKVQFETAKENLASGIISIEQYEKIRKAYQYETLYYKNDFLQNCYEKSENKPPLYIDPYWTDMTSNGYAKRNTGIVFVSLGAAYYLVQLIWGGLMLFDVVWDGPFETFTDIISEEVDNIRYSQDNSSSQTYNVNSWTLNNTTSSQTNTNSSQDIIQDENNKEEYTDVLDQYYKE